MNLNINNKSCHWGSNELQRYRPLRKNQCVTVVDNPVTYSHQKLVAYITFTSYSQDIKQINTHTKQLTACNSNAIF